MGLLLLKLLHLFFTRLVIKKILNYNNKPHTCILKFIIILMFFRGAWPHRNISSFVPMNFQNSRLCLLLYKNGCILGSSRRLDLRLGPQSPCLCQAKKITLQVSPVKSWGWKMTGWTQTPPWTQRKKIFSVFTPGFLIIVLRGFFEG